MKQMIASLQKHLPIYFICMLLGVAPVYAHAADTVQVRTYGGPGLEIAYSMALMPDTGMILAGITGYYGPGNTSVYLVRVDRNGIHKWSKVLGGTEVDVANDIQVSGDSVMYITGYSNSFGSGYDGYVIKTDTGGTLIWERTYGGTDWDFLYASHLLSNGNLLLCGKTFSFTNGNFDCYVVMIDADGNLLWQKNFGGAYNDEFRSVTADINAVYVSGAVTLSSSDSSAGLLIKLDFMGNLIDSLTYSQNGSDGFKDISLVNGELFMSGFARLPDSVANDIWVVRTDTQGNIINSIVGSNPEDDYLNDAALVSGGEMVYCGQKDPSGLGEKSMYLARFDLGGGYKNSTSLGEADDEEGYKALVLPDGRMAFCGYTTSFGQGNEEAYLIIFPFDTINNDYVLFNIGYAEQLSPIGIEENVVVDVQSVFPNPSSGKFCIKESGMKADLFLLSDIRGSVIYSGKPDSNCFYFSDLPAGIYFYSLRFGQKMLHGKLIFN